MTTRPRRVPSVAVLGLLLAAAPVPAQAGALTPAQQRGRQIYRTGHSPSQNPIVAFFGADGVELPEEASACSGCHGYDGTGRPESGLIPSNVTWPYLTKAYGHVHPNGREHGPFTVETLRSYLASGVYPGGQPGDPSMPVYEMAAQDLEDLVAFLAVLGDDTDPGIGETTVRVGTLLPSEGPAAGIGQTMRDVLLATFGAVNQAGGVYGRRIELVVREPGAASLDPEPFALVSPFLPGAGSRSRADPSPGDVPVVGPFTLYPLDDYARNRSTFYLFAGVREQALCLVEFATRRAGLASPRAALVYPASSDLGSIATALETAAQARGWSEVRRVPFSGPEFDAPAVVARLREAQTEVVVFLGVEHQTRSLLEAARALEWAPYVLTPGVLAGEAALDAPRTFAGRLFLAYPTLPQDRDPRAEGELARLLGGRELSPTHRQAAISAYCSAKLLVEALRLSGRALSRARFVWALERFYRFETGLTPPLTYTRNRRFGALGAYVATPDPAADKAGALGPAEWVDAD
ncbi:MAG: ABC transporter substrate-binding protein [Deltaproteobacteria bacterium]|nr:ABC transporter substrate-binding protein [Deltaproteobacteria bacterium]